KGATVTLRQLDVETMAGLAHLHGYKGRVDGSLEVQPGTRRLDFALRGRNLEGPGIKQGGLSLTGTWDHRAADVAADVLRADEKVLGITGKVPVGLHDLIEGFAALRHAPLTVHAETHDLALEKLRPALANKVRLAGRANLDADLTGTVTAPTAKAKLTIDDARVA